MIKKLIHEYDMTSSLSYKKLENEINPDGQLELRTSVSWDMKKNLKISKFLVATLWLK